MIRFEEKKIVIEIATDYPADKWVEIMTDLHRVAGVMDKEFVSNEYDCIYGICDLLNELMPEEMTARKMIEKRGG